MNLECVQFADNNGGQNSDNGVWTSQNKASDHSDRTGSGTVK